MGLDLGQRLAGRGDKTVKMGTKKRGGGGGDNERGERERKRKRGREREQSLTLDMCQRKKEREKKKTKERKDLQMCKTLDKPPIHMHIFSLDFFLFFNPDLFIYGHHSPHSLSNIYKPFIFSLTKQFPSFYWDGPFFTISHN